MAVALLPIVKCAPASKPRFRYLIRTYVRPKLVAGVPAGDDHIWYVKLSGADLKVWIKDTQGT